MDEPRTQCAGKVNYHETVRWQQRISYERLTTARVPAVGFLVMAFLDEKSPPTRRWTR